jgi:thiol:disulfide interchange protein DsbD
MRTTTLLCALVLPFAAFGQDIPPTVSFKTERAAYKQGEDIKGTVTVTFAPGLHGYQNPPVPKDVLPVSVKPGDGTELKSATYPKGFMAEFAGVQAMFYADTISIPVVIAAPKTTGKVTLNLGFFYQQCDENLCYIPTTIPVSAEVTIEAAKAQPDTQEQPDQALPLRPSPGPVSALLTYPTTPIAAGSTFPVTLRLDFGPRAFAFQPDGGPASISVRGTMGTELVAWTGPAGIAETVASKRGLVHKGSVELALTVKAPDKPGEQKFDLEVLITLADDKGPFEPQSQRVTGEITVAELEQPSTEGTPIQESQQDGGLLGFLNNALEKGNWALIVPAALLTGLALCLTPCVFPMIPVTVTFFSNQGSKTKAGRFGLGLFYALGITLTYGAVGGISAAAGGAVGELFTKPWFVVALALLLVALALSMFDVYEIRLPGFITRNLKGRSGPVGALIMGLLMGFAAAPCAGALVGAVAVKVADIGSIPVGLGMFGLIGLGMGLPFMALATASSGAKALPRSGGWLKTTKAVLGLLVLYFAATYLFQGLGMKPEEAGTQLAWIAVFAAMAGYLLFLDKSDATRAVATIKGVACVALGLLIGMAWAEHGKIKLREALGATDSGSQVSALGIDWIEYNDENFAKAVASGKPIMIDGKAEWCLQCKEIEHRVFLAPEGLDALKGVYLMSIDWSTGVDPEYKDMTAKRFGINGLPHIVFMKPGGKDEFVVKDIKTVAELKTLLKRAGAQP